MAVVEVAKEKEFLIKSGIVVVAREKYLMVRDAAEELEILMISESKNAPPLRESFSPGVEDPMPTRSVAVRKVVYPPLEVNAPPTQTPFSWVQILYPAMVEVAVMSNLPVMVLVPPPDILNPWVKESWFAEMPPVKVEVPDPERLRRLAKRLPLTEKVLPGVVVPSPMR